MKNFANNFAAELLMLTVALWIVIIWGLCRGAEPLHTVMLCLIPAALFATLVFGTYALKTYRGNLTQPKEKSS